MGETNLANQNSIQVLPNRAIRKICFKKPNKTVSRDFKKKKWNPKISQSHGISKLSIHLSA